MRKRKRESVLRTKKVKLMLYFPWHSEEALKGRLETYEDHYKNVIHIVDHNTTQFNHNNDHIDNALNAYEENSSPETPGIELQNDRRRKH